MTDGIHHPDGLNQRQLERLEEHVRRGQLLAPDKLLRAAYAHLDDVQAAHVRRSEVDAETAEAICHVLDRLVSDWDAFSPAEQSWLRGAMHYFSKSDDDRPDFEEGGFDDDVEVLNACLEYVRRGQWKLKPNDTSCDS